MPAPTLLYYSCFQLFQCPLQRGAGAGDVEALEALADRTENRAAVEPEPGLVQNQILKRAVVQPQLAEIHPDKVSSLGLDHAQLRQAGVNKFAHNSVQSAGCS